MVKHFKRTHQRGPHSPEMDDMISDGGSDSSPPTPESHAAMPWQPHPMMGHPAHSLQRAASFADFGQHMSGYAMQQPYSQHRHSMSSSGAADYAGHAQAQQPPPHHPGVQMLQRTGSIAHHSYFVPEQNNPGVATMNTGQPPPPQHPQYHPQVPRQGIERLPLEIPPYPNAPDLTSSIANSSPGSFSAASGRSPSAQDGFYTHVPPGQSAAYTLHAATTSPVAQHPPPLRPSATQMMAFQGQLPPSSRQQHQHHHQQQQQQAAATAAAAAHATQAMTAAQHQLQQQHHHSQPPPTPQSPPDQYQHDHDPQTHAQHPHQHQHAQQTAQHQQPQQQQSQQWYDAAQYQSPVEVTTIHGLPPFGAAGTLFDPWAAKIEFDDSGGMQMPSARIESL